MRLNVPLLNNNKELHYCHYKLVISSSWVSFDSQFFRAGGNFFSWLAKWSHQSPQSPHQANYTHHCIFSFSFKTNFNSCKFNLKSMKVEDLNWKCWLRVITGPQEEKGQKSLRKQRGFQFIFTFNFTEVAYILSLLLLAGGHKKQPFDSIASV